MANERSRAGSLNDEGAGEAIGPTYSEKQVAAILQKTAQLERGRAAKKPELTLAEVEAIAREAGLDPSLVRMAAQSIDDRPRESSTKELIAGAPMRRVFERVIDGEISLIDHEALSAALRAGLREERSMRTGAQISSIGRTLTANLRSFNSSIEIEVIPRAGKTLVRIEVNVAPLAGRVYGIFIGAIGVSFSPMIFALGQAVHLGVAATALGIGGLFAGTYGAARTIFPWRAKAQYRRMEKLADQLADRIREELAARPPA